jgi:hypothetical protein
VNRVPAQEARKISDKLASEYAGKIYREGSAEWHQLRQKLAQRHFQNLMTDTRYYSNETLGIENLRRCDSCRSCDVYPAQMSLMKRSDYSIDAKQKAIKGWYCVDCERLEMTGDGGQEHWANVE